MHASQPRRPRCPAKLPIAGPLEATPRAHFSASSLPSSHGALDHPPRPLALTEQTERDFGRQVGKAARLDARAILRTINPQSTRYIARSTRSLDRGASARFSRRASCAEPACIEALLRERAHRGRAQPRRARSAGRDWTDRPRTQFLLHFEGRNQPRLRNVEQRTRPARSSHPPSGGNRCSLVPSPRDR